MNASWACSQSHQQNCTYVDDLFTAFAVETVKNHDPSQPMFLFFAPHAVHDPLEVPAAQLAKFSFINDSRRASYAAMANYIDSHLGTLVQVSGGRTEWC